MILPKSLNEQNLNGKWILILLFANNFNSYYLAKKIVYKPYPSLSFNGNPVNEIQLKKHLGLLLNPNLSFDEHIQCILNKTCKSNHAEGSLVNNL